MNADGARRVWSCDIIDQSRWVFDNSCGTVPANLCTSLVFIEYRARVHIARTLLSAIIAQNYFTRAHVIRNSELSEPPAKPVCPVCSPVWNGIGRDLCTIIPSEARSLLGVQSNACGFARILKCRIWLQKQC